MKTDFEKSPKAIDEETKLENVATKTVLAKEKPTLWKNVLLGGIPGIMIGAAGAASVDAMALPIGSYSDGGDDDVDLHEARSVNDEMSFPEAFAVARAEVGPGGAFVWHGQVYGTYRGDDPEWLQMTPEDRAEHSQNILTHVHAGPYAEDENVSGNHPGEVPEEVPGEASEEVPGEASEEVPGEASEEVPEEVSGDQPAVAPSEVIDKAVDEVVNQLLNEDNNVDYEANEDVSIVGDDNSVETVESDDLIGPDVVLADTDGDGTIDTVLVDANDDGTYDIFSNSNSGSELMTDEPNLDIVDTAEDSLGFDNVPDYTNDADVDNLL